MFQLNTSLPFAAFVNPKIGSTQREQISFQYLQQVQAFAGDPAVGGMAGTSTIPWNKTTEVQGLIVEFYATQGERNPQQNTGYPEDFQAILEANAGPDALWNFSYEQWGLVPGVPAEFKTLNTAEVGTGRAVTVIVP